MLNPTQHMQCLGELQYLWQFMVMPRLTAKQASQVQSRRCKCTAGVTGTALNMQFMLTWRPWSAQAARLASCIATPGQACLVYLGATSDPAKQLHMCQIKPELQDSSNGATSASWHEWFMLLNECVPWCKLKLYLLAWLTAIYVLVRLIKPSR